ncbi:ABC transporter permease [Microbacterium sp. RURRCA19A]|uniref:ABC transporter permease n=1 Tax=Microbacterium sp. RURRCA19A TaxID=1907391 RepID=UPI0009573B9D|nr:ABC transporter permease [Microbacterium sp. RURRCA19A]SIR81125.1 peptide/nickel transport system permease protein [Microbacterium sp. RURRCA19A]
MSGVDLAVIAEAPAPPVRRRGGGTGWGAFALRRLGGLVLSLGLLVLLTFLIVPLIPGDPAVAILGPNASADAVAALRERLHLNDPLPVQFLDYLRGLFTFDLGESFRYNTPVTDTIATKLPYTATTAFGAIVVVILVAIPIGMTVGVLTRSGRRPWLAVGFGAVAGFFASVPAYVAGTLLVVVFAIWLKVLPAGGASTQSAYVLPILALAVGPTFAVARVVVQETYAVLHQDYMRTARGRRLSAARLYIRHALPNLMASTLTLTGLILASLLGGAIVIETVFSLPGLGLEVVQAIIFRDFPVIQGIVLTVGALAILINLLIDVVLGFIDPRTLGGPTHV